MPKAEVILSPTLFRFRSLHDSIITVVVDVLRATSSFCAAFESGVEAILPVQEIHDLPALKSKGYITAGERNGKKVELADYGNSPVIFQKSRPLNGKLAYSTTNGTRAIELAASEGAIVTAALVNLNAVSEFLQTRYQDVVILCSGWKNQVSLEDSVCAGALIEGLLESGNFQPAGDTCLMTLQLWTEAKNDPRKFCSVGDHYQRLLALGVSDDLDYCFSMNSSRIVPVWNGKEFVKA